MSKKSFLPYGRQTLDAADRKAVMRVLRSDYLTQGPEVARFEEAFAKKVGAPYAVAVSSGTAALHLAWLAAGLKSGDEVITTPITFAATANAVLYAGGTPRFADINPATRNLDPSAVARIATTKTRGVSPVHFAGLPIAAKRAVWGLRSDAAIVEDACHALGAEVRTGGRWTPVGACPESDMAVFSFHPVKHIATGEGGMVTTRDRKLYDRIRLLRSHGIEKDSARLTAPVSERGPWYYEMQELGFNYRITDIQCALGLSQLAKLDRFVDRRRALARAYDKLLAPFAGTIQTPRETVGTRASYHLYAVEIDFEKIGTARSRVMEALQRDGIGSQVHYIPVPDQPYYRRRFGNVSRELPRAERYYACALSLPLFPAMTGSDVRRVVVSLGRALGAKGIK